ncbi:MAG: 50S ribosomal protein L17 [Desulfobacteraceae bacterium]|nr:50S ribosomal protein L17 [Desulfobacteraceae bacterium]
MRHRKAGLKLNRTSSHKNAMFRNMVTSLFKHERIRTTDTKAKGLRKWADHLITLAKRGDLHARRQALSIVREKNVVYKLFDEAAERFGSKSGGYTRIIKMGRRPGDAAPVSMIELISVSAEKSEKKKTAEKKVAEIEKKKTTEKKAAEAGKKKTAGKKAAGAEKKKTVEKKDAVDKKEDKPEKKKAKEDSTTISADTDKKSAKKKTPQKTPSDKPEKSVEKKED